MSAGEIAGGEPFSAVELAAWRGFLQTHAMVEARLAEQMEESSSLSLVEAEVLLKLSISEGGCLPLARLNTKTYLTLSASGLSRLVERLARRGLVSREPEQFGDRRSTNVRITKQGRRAWAAAAGPHQALVREVFLNPLGPAQLVAMGSMWKRLLEGELPLDDELDVLPEPEQA